MATPSTGRSLATSGKRSNRLVADARHAALTVPRRSMATLGCDDAPITDHIVDIIPQLRSANHEGQLANSPSCRHARHAAS